MINSLQFLYSIYMLCIVISIITLITTLFFVVPLQFKRAGVKNGLQSLRKKLLTKGILSVFMSIATVIILVSRFFASGDIIRYTNTILILLFVVFWFIREVIESSIYHTQFTEDQIDLHRKIHNAEVEKESKKLDSKRVKR